MAWVNWNNVRDGVGRSKMSLFDRVIRFTASSEEAIEVMDVTEITPQEAIGWLEELIPFLLKLFF